MRAWMPLTVLVGCGSMAGPEAGDAVPVAGDTVFDDIPCGQILDCNTLCEPDDGACYANCYDSAYDGGRQLYDALDGCVADAGCSDWFCVQEQCAIELEQCEQDLPTGGWACYAEGWYEVCEGGVCTDYMAPGAAWGSTREAGEYWAVFDCTEHMTNMVIAWSVNASAEAQVTCEVTECESL